MNDRQKFAKQSVTWLLAVGMAGAVFFQGCSTQRQAVVASTGTNVGVELSENPANQMPQAKLGYNRAELAIVPTNRSASEDAGNTNNGATDVADVLMELNYSGINSSGIYQRLAVGKNAVSQHGAAYLFAKDLDQKKVEAINASLKKIPETPESVRHARYPLSQAYAQLRASKEDAFNKAAKTQGFIDFDNFLTGTPADPTLEQIQNVRAKLEEDADIKAKLNELAKQLFKEN